MDEKGKNKEAKRVNAVKDANKKWLSKFEDIKKARSDKWKAWVKLQEDNYDLKVKRAEKRKAVIEKYFEKKATKKPSPDVIRRQKLLKSKRQETWKYPENAEKERKEAISEASRKARERAR